MQSAESAIGIKRCFYQFRSIEGLRVWKATVQTVNLTVWICDRGWVFFFVKGNRLIQWMLYAK